jgi:hypothetical protein
MDKNAIKKFAVWARTELRDRVTKKIDEYAISADADPNADAVRGKLLTKDEKEQRAKLIAKVKEKGMDQVVEEGAYTWFNRFSALRFMEVNNYLPTRVRVFTDSEGTFHPQILTEAIHLELKGLDMDKVYALKEADDKDALFKYLIITQCNALSDVLPGMFQKIADYTELLFPDNLLREGSVIEKMISDIPEDNWDVTVGGQIEILGWLYQYYISEKHESVVDPLHGKVVAKDEVPAATALFTTDWVVRYIIDNSVGRYWIERNPSSNLKNELDYFVTPKSGEIPIVNESITPEQLTVFDPSMGSAHFGVYAFEVLVKIYTEYGYTERDAAASIVQNNLFGLDIDDRSAQIAYFAIMMKALQYDKRFLHRGIQPHFYSIQESNGINSYTIDYFANGNDALKKDIKSIVDDFKDAKEFGSILQISPVNFTALYARFEEIKAGADISMYTQIVLDQLLPLVEVAEMMSKKYAVVATNPPYLNKYDAKLKNFINDNYKDYSGDLFSVFIYRNFGFCKENGYSGFMTPFVWMFIKSYEKLRNLVIRDKSIETLIQFEYSAFDEATVPICSFVLRNGKEISNGIYFRLTDFKGGMDIQGRKVLEAISNSSCGYLFETTQSNFIRIPGSPFAYWVSKNVYKTYDNQPIGNTVLPRHGLATSDNDRFLKLWFEINIEKASLIQRNNFRKKWFPMNKGGAYRKWYGNLEWVINYENDGEEIKEYATELYRSASRTIQNTQFYFRKGITWSALTSGSLSFRFTDVGAIFGSGAHCAFVSEDDTLLYALGLMNSKINIMFLNIVTATMNKNVDDIRATPFILSRGNVGTIVAIVMQCIKASKQDWDSFETSWDFKRHPLLQYSAFSPQQVAQEASNGFLVMNGITDAYRNWEQECANRFNQLKTNEEELNRIFINIYGLQDELTPEEDDKDVTVRKADLQRDIRSFVSYAIGCMFGRYSLDQGGLIFAGGSWDATKYQTFPADRDNIIPISDDEYFEDDIVNRFVKFVEVVYGKNTLEENLKYISDALGGKGSPREVIRNYFLNDFFKDHCKIYQKRPIYWLFDSGKKNGFKCLIYMHRYQPDTIARIRTDYVHEQQARYQTTIEGLERQLTDALRQSV